MTYEEFSRMLTRDELAAFASNLHDSRGLTVQNYLGCNPGDDFASLINGAFIWSDAALPMGAADLQHQYWQDIYMRSEPPFFIPYITVLENALKL